MPDPDIAAAARKARFEALQQSCAAVQMTAHVAADANFGTGRRLQIEMGIEARDALQLEQRKVKARRERVEFFGWKIPMPFLDGSQLVKNRRMMR